MGCVPCCAVHCRSVLFNPGGIAISDIQQIVLTNLEQLYVRVPGWLQVLRLAGGCAAVDGVLADVQRLLQGGMRQGQPPAIEAALRGAAVRCVGLADVAAGDSSTHTCGLATAATACMLELARFAGTGAQLPCLSMMSVCNTTEKVV